MHAARACHKSQPSLCCPLSPHRLCELTRVVLEGGGCGGAPAGPSRAREGHGNETTRAREARM